MSEAALPSGLVGRTASKPGIFSIDERQWRKFGNWALIWLFLANAAFIAMWAVGAPPRVLDILGIGAIGLLVRPLPAWVRGLTFLTAMTYSVLAFIAGLFNLAISSLLYSVRFLVEIKPTNSTEYIVGGMLLLGISLLALWLQRRNQNFTDIRLVVLAILGTVSLAGLDAHMAQGMRGHYQRAAVEGTPFMSGSQGSGLVPAGGVPDRHLMLIMVESLGEPVGNADMADLLFARYDDPAVTDRFEMTKGETTYYNSTTAGEIRELCGRWGDYYEVLENPDPACLPAKLAAAGYGTRAYHSFTGAFFDRAKWYPNIGFEHEEFGEQLLGRGARECGGVFPGACDRDIPALLANDLKAAEKPQFLYWLTVNSHLPVPPGMNLDVDHCEKISARLAAEYPMICRQFALWDQLDQAIIKEITVPDFPPTDILIVGDHMPPYFDRHHRSQFAPDRVPWMLLRWKGDEEQQSTVAAGRPKAEDGAIG